MLDKCYKYRRRFDTSAHVETAAKGAYLIFIGNIASTGIVAINAFVIGRLLGPSGYGEYSIALIIPTYMVLAIRLGLDSAATRYSARYVVEGLPQRANSFIRSILYFEIGIASLAILLVFPFAQWLTANLLDRPSIPFLIIVVALISVLGQIIFTMGTASFVGIDMYDRSAQTMVIQAVIRVTISTSLLILGFGVFGAIFGFTSGYLVSAFFSLIVLIPITKGPRSQSAVNEMRIAIRYSFPISLANTMNGVLLPFENTILSRVVANAALGGFVAAFNVTATLSLLTVPVATVLLPLFSKFTDEPLRLEEVYNHALKFFAIFVCPVTFFIMVFSTKVMEVLYGPSYASAGVYLLFLSTTGLLYGLGNDVWISFLNGIGRPGVSMAAVGIGAATTIAGSVIIVPLTGVNGAIVSLVAGQVVSLAAATIMIKKVLGFKIKQTIVLRVYLASAFTAAVVYPISLLSLNSFLSLILGGVIFLLLLIPLFALTKAVTQNDADLLLTYFGKMRFLSSPLRLMLRYLRIFLP